MSKLSINMRRMIIKWQDIQWLIVRIKSNRRTRRECRLNNECRDEAERRIQYREFNGMLVIALDNIPVIPVSEYDNEILEDCRDLFGQYIFKQRV